MDPYTHPGDLFQAVSESNGAGRQRTRTTVDPTLARTLLDRYTQRPGRALNTRIVASIAHRLKQPDPKDHVIGEISFGPDGSTVAGKHYLHAIIETGIAADLDVTINTSPPWDFRHDAPLEDQIALAIGDPGAIVHRNDDETITRWSTRAVMAVLNRPGHCGCTGGYDLTGASPRYSVSHADGCVWRRPEPAQGSVVTAMSREPAALLALLAGNADEARTHLRLMSPAELDNLSSAADTLNRLAAAIRREKLRAEALAANTPCDRGYPLGGMNPRTDWCTVVPLHHAGMHQGECGPFTDAGTVKRLPKCGDPNDCRCSYGCDIP